MEKLKQNNKIKWAAVVLKINGVVVKNLKSISYSRQSPGLKKLFK